MSLQTVRSASTVQCVAIERAFYESKLVYPSLFVYFYLVFIIDFIFLFFKCRAFTLNWKSLSQPVRLSEVV